MLSFKSSDAYVISIPIPPCRMGSHISSYNLSVMHVPTITWASAFHFSLCEVRILSSSERIFLCKCYLMIYTVGMWGIGSVRGCCVISIIVSFIWFMAYIQLAIKLYFYFVQLIPPPNYLVCSVENLDCFVRLWLFKISNWYLECIVTQCFEAFE